MDVSQRIDVNLGLRSYPIFVGAGAMELADEFAKTIPHAMFCSSPTRLSGRCTPQAHCRACTTSLRRWRC
jgi:hypothetical protein